MPKVHNGGATEDESSYGKLFIYEAKVIKISIKNWVLKWKVILEISKAANCK